MLLGRRVGHRISSAPQLARRGHQFCNMRDAKARGCPTLSFLFLKGWARYRRADFLVESREGKAIMLNEIVRELKMLTGQRTPIPNSQVQLWMKSEDVDTLGAAYVFLSKAEHVNRVIPPLAFDPVFDFMLRYYEFCVRTDPQSKWANSAYSAGHELVGWFVKMWDEGRDKKYFEKIKSRLAKLYIAGSPELKKCIEHGIVEHLFERKPIRKFFSDWKENPQLQPAYEEGMLWVTSGGTSPLTESRR